jgi:proteasome lid subunit RPN8/RPN11
MSSKKDRNKDLKESNSVRQSGQTASPAPPSLGQSESLLATEKITLRDSSSTIKPVYAEFSGPRNADVALRIAMERRAYADLIAHAKESLDVEVCGVLAGQVCEDSEGLFVRVDVAIRGAAASQASTHVTFTQATWNSIHQTLDRDYPKLSIVGWYHTHPGFGVEFSDMDLFIQKNFFSAPTQIALVTDPLSGAVGICVNTENGPKYLPRFWVDGREQTAKVPSRHSSPAKSESASGVIADDSSPSLERVEARVSQLIQALDEQRASFYRFLLFCGIVFCLAIIGTAGYIVYSQYTSHLEPPKLNSYVPIPVQVGDKTVLLGVGVAEWKVPDELNAVLLKMELLKKAEAERAAKEAAAKGDTNAPAQNPTNQPTPQKQ